MDEARAKKLLETRQRELDQRARVLIEARGHAQTAAERLELAALELKEAALQRLALSTNGASWQSWVETQDWMNQKTKAFAQAQLLKTEWDRRVEKALLAVKEARSDVQRIEALIQRLAEQKQKEEDRRERRTEDEAGARLHTRPLGLAT